MEIECHCCHKKYVNRASYEKHRMKCGNELLDMIYALTKRVEQLEKRLEQHEPEEPESSFRDFIKTDFSEYMVFDWDDKASTIFLKNAQKILSNTTCARQKEKLFVYENGWVRLNVVSLDCIESMVRSIQTKLLKNIPQNENYFKNISKISGVDIKKMALMIRKI